ncbi:MAG: DAK2 domain-containing protein [Clostridia bacterium]|nr:DAK2 domain-containing protein [Clostridia bacterium]
MKKFDTSLLRLMIASAAANLKNNRKQIDDLNIFPVPDGDTGTNMSLTFDGAAQQTLAEDFTKCDKLAAKLASAALRNARGNSGVILSQIIRGFSKGIEGKSDINAEALRSAFSSARKSAYRAVMKPTEGTILTVIRQMAEFAEEHSSDFTEADDFLRAILEAGQKSLVATTNMLPALKKAGVVDAGGKGLITIIEGAVYVLDNDKPIECSEAPAFSASSGATAATEDVDIKFLYCTEFIINKTANRSVTQFKAAICEKGDCMLVIEDEDIVKVHIHTNNPGFVLEQAVKLGELTNLKIENMKYQHNDIQAQKEADCAPTENVQEEAVKAAPEKKYGFAVVSAGDGLSEIFRSLNADEIIEGGQTMNPSTQDLLTAVDKIPAEIVFILPNNKNIILAADQVAPLTDKQVFVIPTVNIPQGISAMSAFDESLEVDDNIAAMKEFMEYVACGQVTFAARDTVLDGMEIHLGDCLAVCGKEITNVTKTPEEAALNVVEKLITDEAGVISLYYGEDTTKEDAQRLSKQLSEQYSDLDVSLYYGGQPVYYYIISVE